MGVTGAILSGGMSRRMGVPKAGLLLPDGRSMIETVRDMLLELCDEVVLLGGGFGLEGHRVLEDTRDDAGPLAGIEALLQSGLDERYLVFPCDMPGMDPDTARLLMDEENTPGIVHFNGHPLPCMVSGSLCDGLTATLDEGVRSIRDWQERNKARSITARSPGIDDADTPEEYEALWFQLRDRST